MALNVSRKQSLWIGIGLLGTFFIVSGVIVSVRSAGRIPKSTTGLTKEGVTGEESNPSATTGNESAGFVLNDFHRSLVRDGRTVWEIFGARGKYSPGNANAEVEKPRLTLSTKSGDTATLTAGRAVLSLSGADLSQADLFDDVVVHYKDKTTLRTTRATYTKSSNSVLVPVHVEIENDVVFISGSRLTGNLDLQEFTIDGGVTSVIKPKNGS